MTTGKSLIDDVDAYNGSRGEFALWALGQHSFIVKVAGKVIYLDPFLSPFEGRLIPPLLEPGHTMHADIICGSHDHADHIDRDVWPALAAASDAIFVVPNLIRENLSRELKIPLDRLVGLDDGKSVNIDGVRIRAIAAAHEFLDQDPATGQYPYLGFIIETNGCTIYHAGDTCIYDGMLPKLKKWKFDVAFLPINGRDAKRFRRNIIGNMTYQEAVDLAGALMPRLAIPTHYDMFAANSANPQDFVEYASVKFPKLKTHVFTHGERVVVKTH
jgi:L-ascorbate 6-phosphate lactonase